MNNDIINLEAIKKHDQTEAQSQQSSLSPKFLSQSKPHQHQHQHQHQQQQQQQVSSSLLSISSISNKKFKNSSLSLNKKLNVGNNLLSTIKNSTLNVLNRSSNTQSPQLNKKPIDLEAHIIVDKKNELNQDDLDKISSSSENEEEEEEEEEEAFVEGLRTDDKKLLCEQEECDEDYDEDDEYEDIDLSKCNKVSKLNTASVPKTSLKTLSYINTSNSSANLTQTIQQNEKKILKSILNNTSSNNTPSSPILAETKQSFFSNQTSLKLKPNPPQSVSFSRDTLIINQRNEDKTEHNYLKSQTSTLSAPVYAESKPSLDLNLSSSFTTSTINSNSPYSPYSSQLPVKVLHKTMTKGSKAMRIMGSNNTGIITNGMIKNSDQLSINKFNSTSSKSIISKKQQQKRLFFKNGNINISRCNIDKRRRRYLTDIFTTLIDLKWRYNILVFALGFFVSWTIFAILWYLISYIHGDLESTDTNRTACISGIHGFAGAILFSIETQQTIGYGVRFTTEKCPEAILVMMIQSSVGVMIQSFMVGVVFAKLSRPKKRSETLMFSKNAVISLRDGRLCLICRVGDMRKSHIVEAHVRMYLIKKKVTLEGEIMPLHMYDLNVGWDKGLDRLFLVWPLTIEHNIDENSPFWTLSAEDLKKERFELAVILEGIVESTGMTTQARSSYLVNEILWGHRFEKLITFQKEDGTYKIDYSRFDMTVPIDTPTCSAKELAELREQENYFNLVNLSDSTPSMTGEVRKRKVDSSNKEDEDLQLITTPNIRVEDLSTLNNNSNNNLLASRTSTEQNFFLSTNEAENNLTPNTTTTSLNQSSNDFISNQFIK